jgi:hypothetical protein
MQLNELIEKEGLEAVSEKTNISLDNLNRLINEDFEGLNRVKALGFLSILQREYGVDIGALDASIRSYFEEHTPNSDEPLLVSIDKSNSGGGLFKWIVILAFLGGVWYLYSTGKLDKLLGKNADTQKSSISDTEILKSNISDDKAKESVIIKKEANETKVEIKTAPKTVVAKEENTKELNQTEENKTQVATQNSEDKVKITADIPKDKNDTKDENKTILVSKDAGIEEPQKVSEVIDSDSTTEEADKNQTITNITINPTRGMLWYGFINIDTGKKKEFMKNESTPFELNSGRWILTTGHGFLDIVSDVKTIEVSDRVRHYFYIDSKEIKEISRAEFKKLNHGRMW